MNSNHNKIIGLIKRTKVQKVNPELNQRTLKAAANLKIDKTASQSIHKPFFSFIFLTHIFMGNIKKYASIALVLVVVLVGVVMYNGVSYATHVANAREALAQLEQVISGQSSQSALIPSALADEDEVDEDEVDEDEVEDLTEEIVEETEAAIEAAEDLDDLDSLENALEVI